MNFRRFINLKIEFDIYKDNNDLYLFIKDDYESGIHLALNNNASARWNKLSDYIKPNQNIYRVHGINLSEKFKKKGLGQKLYLLGMGEFNGLNNWFFNSQSEPDAIKCKKELLDKNLIEIHSLHYEEVIDLPLNGVYIMKLTENGHQEYINIKNNYTINYKSFDEL